MLLILLYHTILEDERQSLSSAEDPYYAVSRKDFVEQMECLKGSNAEILELGAAIEKCSSSKEAKKYVVLTFDDGLKSHYDIAKSILEQYGFIGHFFITVDNIGKTGYMSWDELIDLKKDGQIIGSHGMSHRILTALDREGLVKELQDSRLMISKIVGESIDYFSVPGGFYSSQMREIAKEVGYQAVLTSNMGINRDDLSRYDLKRIAIRKNTSIEKFRRIIQQGQIPAGDKVKYFSKKAVQKIVGDERYHRFREMVVQ